MKSIMSFELESLVTETGQHNSTESAPGFEFDSTPSHGYLVTSREITQSIPSYMRSTPYSRPGRYEEDVDWSIPVIVHRHLFTRDLQLAALKTFFHWHPDHFEKYFELIPADSYKRSKALAQ